MARIAPESGVHICLRAKTTKEVDAFHAAAVDQARAHVRDGLPLRAVINVVGYLARKPEEDCQR